MTSEVIIDRNEQGMFEQFRNGFPALKEKTFLSVCDKMILHNDVRKNIEKFLDHMSMASVNRVDHEVNVTTSKEKFARLTNV